MAWVFLAAAIVAEVAGTLSLRMATVASKLWYLAVVAGYAVSFPMLALSLAFGMALGVAYGVWSAVGVALTAVLSRVWFKEPLTPLMMGGIVLIAAGVLCIEFGAAH